MIEHHGSSHKITAAHLARKAVVYLRQSSPKQVRENLESQRLQYALADRARALGFERVEIVDGDLGRSASLGAAVREGFEGLVASVALGQVGMVLGRELSRLARTDKDFCHLLEVCQVFGTLIADDAQIYDLGVTDDVLVLGIKGTLSVVELKILKARLLEGQREKASRGELVRLLPPGYVVDAGGKMVKDPDTRVQEAMALVFHKFRELWTVRQTFKWFHDQEVELPVNKFVAGRRTLVWQLPTQSFLSHVLRNPFFAGAYVYGQYPTETVLVEGRLRKRQRWMRPPEECRVFLRDHHEGYIDWETYQENQRMKRGNSLDLQSDPAVSAVREGQGLLVGVLRCGRCGRRMHVRYWGRKGTHGRYLCIGDYQAGGRYCIAFGGGVVDRRVSERLLEVIAPLGIEASLRALEELTGQDDERRQARARKVEQLEYEAQRAFEQYNEVDPRNRLVATELERRWNEKLHELEQARTSLAELERAPRSVSAEDRERLLGLGRDFAAVWRSEHCPMELKKKIVRTLVEEVIAYAEGDGQKLRFVIHWSGGAHTEFEMDKPGHGSYGKKTSMEALEVIGRMAGRYGDDQIAAVLNRSGYRTAKDKRWNQTRVFTVRNRYQIPDSPLDADVLNAEAAARYCGVSIMAIRRLVAIGVLKCEQVVPYAPWEIRRSDLDSPALRSMLERLKQTGKLGTLELEGDGSQSQQRLFTEN
jgi:DNA invertase Pin-like site-specific DNA recombinase